MSNSQVSKKRKISECNDNNKCSKCNKVLLSTAELAHMSKNKKKYNNVFIKICELEETARSKIIEMYKNSDVDVIDLYVDKESKYKEQLKEIHEKINKLIDHKNNSIKELKQSLGYTEYDDFLMDKHFHIREQLCCIQKK